MRGVALGIIAAALIVGAACSSKSLVQPDPSLVESQESQTQARPMPEYRPKVRVKIQPRHTYTYEIAWSAATDQFVVTSHPLEDPEPLEPAPRIRLSISAPARSEANADTVAETSGTRQAVKTTVHKTKEQATNALLPVNPPRRVNPPRCVNNQTKLTVYFGFNETELRPSEAEKLKNFIAALPAVSSQAGLKKAPIHVAGYTCWLGPKQVNDRIALARAMAVVEYLSARGVKVTSVSANGKCCYVDRSNPAPNRRAEVSVLISGERG